LRFGSFLEDKTRYSPHTLFGVVASGKVSAIPFGTSWAATGSLSTGRYNWEGQGTTDSCLAVGGWSGGAAQSSTEEFSGSTWASGGSTSGTVRYHAVFGSSINDGALAGNATASTASQEYNGTSWSGGGTMSTARKQPKSSGSVSDGMVIMGRDGGATRLTSCEEYNGTSFSAGGATSEAKNLHGAGGEGQSDMIAFAGYSTGSVKTCEEYNGTSWSSGGSTTSLAHNVAGAAAGGASKGLGNGGVGNTTTTEVYESGSWSSGGAMNTSRNLAATAGDAITATTYGGAGSKTSTEKYS